MQPNAPIAALPQVQPEIPMDSKTHKVSTDWVKCPVCGESDMRRTTDEEENALIFCVNHNCLSNGGTNKDLLDVASANMQVSVTPVSSPMAPSQLDPSDLVMKPMSSAPRPSEDEYFQLLVLDEWSEGGQLCRGWALVYWLDAFDGRPSGWYGRDCGDLRHPLGWILSTKDLPLR